MYNNAFNIERWTRQRDEIDNLIKAYQNANQTPVNNFINTNPQNSTNSMFDYKKLNDTDEVENILVTNDTIFIGGNRMQIKKLDGTIEKYNIEKYYPVDERDEKIKELNKKVEELERKLNNEPTKSTITVEKFNKSNEYDDGDVKSNSKTNGKSVSK